MSIRSRKLAKTMKANRISAVWVIPIVTVIIGIWMVYSHFADQGRVVTLITHDASGIVAGKTVIKSRSVDVGIVEKVTLSDDYTQVLIQGRLYKNMDPLIKKDSIFWIVQPQIGKDGVSGLGTLLSGVYIELLSGEASEASKSESFNLLNSPPLLMPSDAGIRINLVSDQDSVISKGAAVMFRGFQVGSVETSEFDVKARNMKYQLFIAKPYDSLVTQNIRFWKEGGIDLSLSARGASLQIPSVSALLSGAVSFDVPDGSKLGVPAKPLSTYKLFKDKSAILNSQYTEYTEFLLFFDDSISGLVEGAPVEYRGIRLGTVSKVPFFSKDIMKEDSVLSYNIPVLIRVEPGRLSDLFNAPVDLANLLINEQKNGLRAALKSSNFFTGSLFVDIDFYPEYKDDNKSYPKQQFGYDTLQTVSVGFSQLQAKLIQTLDNINGLPLNQTLNDFNQTMEKSQKLLESLTAIVNSKEMQNLPKDIKATVNSLNKTLQSVQPGSNLHNKINTDLQKLEKVMDELSPILETLNQKSNSLIFAAPKKEDPMPKAKGN